MKSKKVCKIPTKMLAKLLNPCEEKMPSVLILQNSSGRIIETLCFLKLQSIFLGGT